MQVTQHKAIEVAILLHANQESRHRLITTIHNSFDGCESLDANLLIHKLQIIASSGPPDFQVDANYYGLCLRLELLMP